MDFSQSTPTHTVNILGDVSITHIKETYVETVLIMILEKRCFPNSRRLNMVPFKKICEIRTEINVSDVTNVSLFP